jgi:hypothetical protein
VRLAYPKCATPSGSGDVHSHEGDMNDRTWRNLAVFLAVILALLGGVTGALLLGGGRATPTASPSGTAFALLSPSPSVGESPSASVIPSASAPGGSPSPSAALKPTPAPTPVPVASITFVGLKLDAKTDTTGSTKTLAFASAGTGEVSATINVTSPQGTARMCLSRGSSVAVCKETASGVLTGTTTSSTTTAWVVTLRGVGIDTPTADVSVTFRARHPSVILRKARFDGTAYPEYNGITAVFKPRANGPMRLVASWGGHPFMYGITIQDVSHPSPGGTFPARGPATKTNFSFPVTAPDDWRLTLQNGEAGFGPTSMTVTVSWP